MKWNNQRGLYRGKGGGGGGGGAGGGGGWVGWKIWSFNGHKPLLNAWFKKL